ncbi:hypothetical protein [Thermotalea metallivorans]|uniref:Uncharacterized protein n=1 Tax=Thermotalea metallivorans TaxID=520762 RepID=A0A140L2P8_9FIRM|nr:hypothetical protein [Thermotalea metallivorans]KXG74823.1 hypothetical protein AN619_21640 [Thermotalea metallivorans]
MSDRFIHYNGELGLSANGRLLEIIKKVGPEDELIITMDAVESHRAGYILDILRDHGFEVLPKGGHEGEKYHIIAHRKKHN